MSIIMLIPLLAILVVAAFLIQTFRISALVKSFDDGVTDEKAGRLFKLLRYMTVGRGGPKQIFWQRVAVCYRKLESSSEVSREHKVAIRNRLIRMKVIDPDSGK